VIRRDHRLPVDLPSFSKHPGESVIVPCGGDAWYATATDPDATRTFLKWAIASRAMPRLDVPARRHAERAPISQHRRLALIHRFPTDKRIELRTRVAGCLLLLYAQPVSRLAP